MEIAKKFVCLHCGADWKLLGSPGRCSECRVISTAIVVEDKKDG